MNISRSVCTIVTTLLMMIPSAQQFAQSDPEVEAWIAAATAPRELVIVGSTPSYASARRRAVEAARRLEIPLDLRNLVPHKKYGLTFSKSDCEGDGGSYPCYLPRGRRDDEIHVSIEYSSSYDELRPNLYIVVIANGPVGSDVTSGAKQMAAAHFPDVYMRVVDVYLGCIH